MSKKKHPFIFRLEEFLLVLLIIMGVLDFFEVLPGDLDYGKKIISWTVLGYLVYKVSLTSIFFNHRRRAIDLLLVLSYFFLIVKNMGEYIKTNLEHFNFLHDFALFLVRHLSLLEAGGFLLGVSSLLLLAIYCTSTIPINKPSLMHVIHEEGPPPKTFISFLLRFITIFFVFLSFFIVVFNLVMEWLAIAVDAFLVMIAIIFYLFIVLRHYRNFGAETLIFKIGEFGEGFYTRFLSLFHYKKTLYLGICGMLALHLLTEIGNFLVPFIFNIYDPLYLEHLGPGHTALLPLFFLQSQPYGLVEQFSLFLIYTLNILALFFLLLFPSFIWYILFKAEKVKVNNTLLALFFSSLFVLLVAPVFLLRRLPPGERVGVDIITQPVTNYFFPTYFSVIITAMLLFFVGKYLIHYLRKASIMLGLITGLTFFGYYIFLFFSSLREYYSTGIVHVFFSSSNLLSIQTFFSFILLLFFTITVMFYIGGFVLFMYEVRKRSVINYLL